VLSGEAAHIGCTSATMESDIPSELDIADCRTDGRGIGQYTTELKSTLVLKVVGAVSGDGMPQS